MELTAQLSQLEARVVELDISIARLNGEIEETQTAINTATQKRNDEHDAFTVEQTNFDNSLRACNKAIEILKQHYGDGTETQAERPAWMTLVQMTHILQNAVKKRHEKVSPIILNFLQGPFDRHQAKTGEALGIVDQMKLLGETFAEDKQSAIDEENRLQKLYTDLMAEKTALLNSLITERDENQ